MLKLLRGASCTVALKKERQVKRIEGLKNAVLTEEIKQDLQAAYDEEHLVIREKNVKYQWKQGYRNERQ